ncbi:MAG: hypothetical protein HZB95_06520 [Nitrosomonadales bacterium]|nr:hypothetical protein [Nitrosomonadales bacterium]
MRNKMKFHPVLTAFTMLLTTTAFAAAQQQGDLSWYAESGLGYDSNAFQAPRNAYFDYAVGATQNTTVVPQAKSGFFVPYKAKVEAGKRHEMNGRLVGSATVDGRFYAGGLGNADEFNLETKGGMTFELGGTAKRDKKAYAGLVLEKHNQVYVDHDSGASKVTAGGSNISNRYNYTSTGVEGEFKDDSGTVDYSIKGQYLTNDYDDPVAVSQMDHDYFRLGGEADLEVKAGTKLKFSAAYSTRDYAERRARQANGVYAAANPVLKYTYNDLGVTLRNRMNGEMVVYVDYDYSQRTDNYVNYGDYKAHRIGGRVLYEQGQLSGRVSLHHWKRDYPHAFAYDVAGQPAKNYSGNDLVIKAAYVQTKQLSFWAEAIIETQDSSDKRYAYDRKQLMAGARWDM